MNSGRPPVATFFFGSLTVAAVLLGVQLPFLYYSDDIVYHAAKVMAAADGDFYTDPVTGFRSLYPPLYHMLVGSAAHLFGLSSFATSRAVQIVQFLGLFLSALLLFSRTLRTREQATLGGLILILLMYAPTGRYWLLGNPFNFSIMFVLAGAALAVDWYRSNRLWRGAFGAVLAGVGVNIWWWNCFPLFGVALGLIVMFALRHELRSRLGGLAVIGGVMAIVLAWNLWPVYRVLDVLPNYSGHMSETSFAAEHGTPAALWTWATGFLLKGNQQFFKYLYPEALSSENALIVVYGLAASVYFYLIVVPFNLALLAGSWRESVSRLTAGGRDRLPVLLLAAGSTLLLSLATLYQTNSSVTRRVQFYCFVFLVPAFVVFLYDRWRLDRRPRLQWMLVILCAGAFVYNAVYRFELTLTDPVSPETAEVAEFIRSVPNHADTRFFVTERDNHLLLRTARYRSFLLRGNPTYFRQDKPQADSIEQAYREIVATGEKTERWLEEFETRYAILGKTAAAISPVMNEISRDPAGARMLAWFRERTEPVLENSEWAVFALDYPLSADTTDLSPPDSEASNPSGR